MSWLPEKLSKWNEDQMKSFVQYIIWHGIGSSDVDELENPEDYDDQDKLDYIRAIILQQYLDNPEKTRTNLVYDIWEKINSLKSKHPQLAGIYQYQSILFDNNIPIDKALFGIPFKYIDAYGL